MKKKLPALLALWMLAFAGNAGALETDDLIAITAMPLVVADVVALPDVPRDDVVTVVTTLNRAAVPAPQFVEIVRYAPVALIEPSEPRFVSYVTQEYDRGIVGEPLALAIAGRYDTYGYDDVVINDPPVVTLVEQREILPQVVTTRFQPVEFDPLALVAMPLAVAAVADLIDVPRTDLMSFVSSLNQALVPAPQFVELVRYSPVMLVDRTQSPQLIQFVSSEVDRGIIGRPLAYAIANRIDTFQPVGIDVVAPRPRVIVERDEILPPVVVTRVASAHPHGGPPGQLKKQLGLQTGAEVVHGSRPARTTRTAVRTDDRDERRAPRVRVAKERQVRPRVVRSNDGNSGKAKPRVAPSSRGRGSASHVRPQERKTAPVVKQRGAGGKSHGNSGGGKGKGNGKGKGKGKG